MFPIPFCLYNDEPFLFSENEAQELRDLIDALKHGVYIQLSCIVNSETIMSTQQLHYFTIKSLFCLSNFYFKKCYKY